MKKKIETKQDGKKFERFEQLLSQVVKVPKDEILKREKAEKQKKETRKAKRDKPFFFFPRLVVRFDSRAVRRKSDAYR